jgi:acetylornithine deacetylase
MTTDLVELASRLIAVPTFNPGGDERRLAALLVDELAARGPDAAWLVEVGEHACALARWGKPRLLVNVHLDTVPADAGWAEDPWTPRVDGDWLVGLGSADTKGAMAAVLGALDAARPEGVLVAFTGDEELEGTCIRHLVETGALAGVERAIVCEPTSCRAGVRHRGVIGLHARVEGTGGHSSQADHLPAPVAALARVAVAWSDWGRARRDEGPEGFRGTCLNIARLEGGVAFNVVPKEAKLTASLRPAPGADARAMVDELVALAGDARVDVTLFNPTFATRDLAGYRPLLGELADRPVDLAFWTEAAVLSEAGIDAVVFGPGDISRAHRADERVPIAELARARDVFAAAFRSHGAG